MGGRINNNGGNNKQFQLGKLSSSASSKSGSQKLSSMQENAFSLSNNTGTPNTHRASQAANLFGSMSSAKKAPNTIKTSGNYEFNTDTNAKIAKSDYSKLKKAGGKAGNLFGDGSINIKDGINAEEAKSIIV